MGIQPYKDKQGNNIYPDESNFFRCERCNENKVVQKPGSSYIPKFCPECLKVRRGQNIRNARKVKHDKKEKDKLIGLEEIVAPSGQKVFLKNKDEKEYYAHHKKAYLRDFDF